MAQFMGGWQKGGALEGVALESGEIKIWNLWQDLSALANRHEKLLSQAQVPARDDMKRGSVVGPRTPRRNKQTDKRHEQETTRPERGGDKRNERRPGRPRRRPRKGRRREGKLTAPERSS